MSSATFANALSIEQLQVFVEVVDSGSFSRAARKLNRAQGSVSYHIHGLEEQLGVLLFDRTQRPPALTDAGHVVLSLARQIGADVDRLRRVAWNMNEGLEPRVRLAVDVLFAPERLAALLAEFEARFAEVDLFVTSGIVDFAAKQVATDQADIGISGPIGLSRKLVQAPCGAVELVPVIAPSHPLAQWEKPVPDHELARHVHILLSQMPKGDGDGGPATGFPSPRRWHIGDPWTRRVLVRAGLGWARLPRSEIEADLADGRLRAFSAEYFAGGPMMVPLSVIHRQGALLGKASRWLFERVTTIEVPEASK